MNIDRLVAMANQIGAFFRLQEEAAAVAAIEEHLRLYWDPRMRTQILEHLTAGGQGLSPLVRQALVRLAGAARA